MLFMVIERFRDDDMVPIYRRLEAQGRGLPDGLEYVDSWVEANFSRLFQEWALHWRGLGATFEIVPVVPGAETAATVAPRLEPDANTG